MIIRWQSGQLVILKKLESGHSSFETDGRVKTVNSGCYFHLVRSKFLPALCRSYCLIILLIFMSTKMELPRRRQDRFLNGYRKHSSINWFCIERTVFGQHTPWRNPNGFFSGSIFIKISVCTKAIHSGRSEISRKNRKKILQTCAETWSITLKIRLKLVIKQKGGHVDHVLLITALFGNRIIL